MGDCAEGKRSLVPPSLTEGGEDIQADAASSHMANVASAFFVMKTYGHLWERIVSFENLYQSFLEAKRYKRFDPPVLDFASRLEENLVDIQNRLIWHAWEPGRWTHFTIHEPKRREICAPPFKDRVVHHALVRVTEPLFERRFIDHSYACRVGKGTHAAAARALALTRKARRNWGDYWVLKCDIAKCFPSIRHDVAKGIIRKVVRDSDTLWLWDTIIDKSGYEERGIPIGALTSQLIANITLDPLDHFIMDDLGYGDYCRYMDDFLVVDADKGRLWALKEAVEDFLESRLSLRLNGKSTVLKGVQGVDFCGYRIWPTHVLPRKRNVKRARRRLKRLVPLVASGAAEPSALEGCLASFHGYLKYCCGHETEYYVNFDIAQRSSVALEEEVPDER